MSETGSKLLFLQTEDGHTRGRKQAPVTTIRKYRIVREDGGRWVSAKLEREAKRLEGKDGGEK
jgi:hypothetical protein